MSRNEQNIPELESQESYEAAVLDFLDREMAAIQPNKKANEQSEELDALVSDLLKQVITESGQPTNEQQAASDGLQDVFSEFPAEEVEPFPPTRKDPESPAASAAASVGGQEKSSAEPGWEVSPIQSPASHKAPAFAPIMASGSKVPLIAVACACLLIVIAATIYYSLRSPKSAAKTEESETAASASVFPSDPSQDRPAPAPPTTHKAAAQQKISPNPGRDLSSAAVSGPVNAVPVHNPEAAKTAAMTTAKAAPETDTGASSAPPAPLPDRETNPIAAKSPALPTDSPALGSEVQAINVTGRASSPLAENIDPEITTQNRTLTALPASVPLSAGKPAPNSQSVAPASAVSRALIPAVPISQISPVYPELAIQSHTYGSVVLDVRINEEGKVVKATPVSGPTVLYSAAVKAVMQWRYKPASIGGKNVSSQTRVTMVFKP